jgi:hypothetical protein
MQFLRQMAANKRAITGIKSRHYVAVMLNSAKHEVSAARDIAAEAACRSFDLGFDSL